MRFLMSFLPKRARKGGAKGENKRPPRRSRVVPWWRTGSAQALAMSLPVLMLLGLGAWGWHADWPLRFAAWISDGVDAVMVDLGLTVDEVYVAGRRETERRQLLDALAVKRGEPILSVNLEAARARVLALPWVRRASLRRVLPSTLVLEIIERRPLALWQHEKRFALIDDEGTVIKSTGLERFADLIVVVGPEAPPHAADLVDLLDRHPDLRPHVRAAVWVGNRRWNVRLDGGIDVRLPEQDPGAAWARLADYQRRHHVLERDVRILDLRFPDQVIVRRAGKPPEPPAAKGRDT